MRYRLIYKSIINNYFYFFLFFFILYLESTYLCIVNKNNMETPEIYTDKLELTFAEMFLLQCIVNRLKTVEHEILDTHSFKISARDKENFQSLCAKIKNHKPF